jgi:hypothetical protein
MSLQKQKIPLSLVTGMDTKTDEFNSTSFKLLENLKTHKPQSLLKRYGHQELSKSVIGIATTQSDIASANYLLNSNNSLLLASSTGTYNYSAVQNKWLNLNQATYTNSINSELAACEYSEDSIISGKGLLYDTKYVENANYIVTTSLSSEYISPSQFNRNLNIKIENKTEKTTVIQDIISLTTSGTNPVSLEIFPTYCLVIYRDSTVVRILKYTFSSTTITSADTVFLSGISSSLYFDTCNDGTHTYFAAVDGASNNVYIYKIASDLTSSNVTYADSGYTKANSLQVGFYSGGLRLAYFDSDASKNIRHVGYTTALVQSYAPADLNSTPTNGFVRAVSFISDNTNTYFFYTICEAETTYSGTFPITYGTGQNHLYTKVLLDSNNTVTTAETEVLREVLVQTRPEIINNNIYLGITKIWGQYHIKPFQTYFVLAINKTSLKQTIAGKSLYLEYKPFLPLNGYSLQKFYKSSEKLTLSLPKTTSVLSETLYAVNTNTAEQYTDIVRASFDYDYNALTQTNLNGGLYISGSVLKYYDGKSLVEDNFLDEPYIYGVTSVAGTLSSGVYSIYAVSKWVDNFGNIHRGVPVNYTQSLSTGFQLSLGGTFITQKQNLQLEIYMTAADGSIPYLQNTLNYTTVASKGLALLFDADSDIKTNTEVLYTVSGELENDPATAAGFVTSFKNRIWTLDNNKIQYSKYLEEGYPISFNANFEIPLTAEGGNNIGLQGMDNVMVLFKENSIFIISGDGPNNTGEGSFSQPQPISSDVGCVEANSIISTPDGIMFKSEKGIYILNRGLYVSYIGAPVESYNADLILSSTLVNDLNEIRFLTNDNTVLCYDYYNKSWNIETYTDVVDMLVLGNTTYLVSSTGTVMKEDSTLFKDGSSHYNGKFETNWITVGSINVNGSMQTSAQGFQRLYTINVLGKYRSAHNLKVSLAYNYSDTVIDYATIVPTGTGVYQFEVKPSLQKCEAFKIIVEDTNQSGTGESMVISHILLEVGIKGSAQKVVADSNRFAAT